MANIYDDVSNKVHSLLNKIDDPKYVWVVFDIDFTLMELNDIGGFLDTGRIVRGIP